ncbi:type II toxin-antitoxin system RelE/ParE family toxin [Mitsuaria sp. GD03876]|uniref:type II toxin-antitoxin system RelE/ParE family toxin n=1 Tax=Mitsuaria sp. GD03876 TaxID=2975399 RepID=UPI0024489D6E|nr:type II toxin-antitoxin system RelE/ParE family toxin [Mitsuaria sp. GD03876]MDH0867754.1 type II toxin-antitoxin system RelE/ParE family toxin [Mitsuaria sp. GD03876]
MKVSLHPEAWADVRSIHQYIATSNRRRADSFLRELREKIIALGRVGESYPVLQGFERSGFRRRTHGNYRIFYRVLGGAIEVTHVMHMSRDHTPLLAAWNRLKGK